MLSIGSHLPVALALSGVAVTAGTLVLPSAAAAASGTPAQATVVTSSATGLSSALPSFTLASGTSSTSALGNGSLQALGAGVLAPSPSGEASASTAPGGSKTAPRTCGGKLPAFPAPFAGVLTAGAACGSAAVASTSQFAGTARATGDAASLGLDLAFVLNQVVKPASPVASALRGILGKLPPIPAGGETVSSLLRQVERLSKAALGVQAQIGPSTSASTVGASGWTTTAEASGAVITLVPGGGIGGAPLAKIVVGSASATASVDRPGSAGGTGHPSAKDSPALVTVEVNAPATGSKTFSVVPGQSLTILQGTPLQSTIAVAAGSVTTAPDGAVTAEANAVSIALAEGVGASPATADNGGLHIKLADARATAFPTFVKPAVTPPAQKTAPQTTLAAVPNATVPHTGLPWAGGAPVLAGGALTGAGLLSWPRLRRRLHRRAG